MKAWMLICCSLLLVPTKSRGQESDRQSEIKEIQVRLARELNPTEKAILSARYVTLQREVLFEESLETSATLLSQIPGDEPAPADARVSSPERTSGPPPRAPTTSRK